MAKENTSSHGKRSRRRYTKEFREEAVQMMLDGPRRRRWPNDWGCQGRTFCIAGNSRCSPAAVRLLLAVFLIEQEVSSGLWERHTLGCRTACPYGQYGRTMLATTYCG